MKYYKFRYLVALAIPVVAMIMVTPIQLLMFKLGILPDKAGKITSNHMFLIIVVQAAILIFISLSVVKIFKFDFFRIGEEVTIRDLFLGFSGLFAVNLVSTLFLKIVGAEPEQFKYLNKELLLSNVYLFMFTVAFLGPIYEEFVFRGVILGLLCFKETAAVKIVPAVIFSAALFMASHFDDMTQNFLIGFPLFLLGLYFAFWTIRKKGIMITIILHMSQNLMAGLGMLYTTKTGM